ncbi:MAG: hypothetical protein ACREF4_20960 [Gammaproteobacteria bacterium]
MTTTDPVRTSHNGQDSRLAILGRVSTEEALHLPAGISFVAWCGVGVELVRIEKGIQWWLGDWWNFGENKFGEEAYQAIRETGYESETIRKFAYVADRVPEVRRRLGVPWSYHDAVASLDADDQDEILDQVQAAAERGEPMNVHHVRSKAKNRRAQNGEPDPPQPQWSHPFKCPECGHTGDEDEFRT